MPPSTYREPACARRATPAPMPRAGASSVATLASLAGIAGASALAVGHLELLALAGAGAAAAALSAVRAVTARRQTSAALSFLDTDVLVEGPGTWTSPDGTRRLRAVVDDPLVRWERLDPSTGQTLASFRAAAASAPSAIDVDALACRVAPIFGRAREPRCFVGAPPEVRRFGSAVAVEARCVVLVVRRDGVLVERRDATGELIGDTLHPHERAALSQIEAEYGDRVGRFRAAEMPVPAPIVTATPRPSWDDPIDSRLAL